MISCSQLSKVYRGASGPVNSLDAVDLEVRAGEFVGVRGPSGCGKTTLLLAIGGMLRPTRGLVMVNGRELYALEAAARARYRARTIGFVFQMFHLLPYLTALENVLLAAGPGSNGGSSRALALLEELGLAARAQHKPAALSAGERQRTAVARALFNEPSLILADEPTGNLDPENAGEVLKHLQAFHRRGGTVVVVTHGSGADAYADRVIEMRQGRIIPL